MKDAVTKGYAFGLSSHSSMQNSSDMFKKSEIFEVSSISKNEDIDHTSKENILSEIIPLVCRFCGRNSEKEALVTVCRCENRCYGHKTCVNGQSEGKCKKCGRKWLKEVSIFKSTPDIIAKDFSSKHVPSVINESSGEIRMRNIIKAATQKPVCRICKEDNDSEENKIVYPCQCHTINVTYAWAHRECILGVIIKNQKDECDLCKAKFSFLAYYSNVWVCQEKDMYCNYFAVIIKLLLTMCLVGGLIAFLSIMKELYIYEQYTFIWGTILLIALVILLCLLLIVFVSYIFKKSINKVILRLEVLCQKQEIAKMSSKSHEMFLEYIAMLRKKKLIPNSVKVKRSKEILCKIDESEVERVLQPRLGLDLDTNGENIESDLLKEYSNPKASSGGHNKSEDFKEEDICEHSESN